MPQIARQDREFVRPSGCGDRNVFKPWPMRTGFVENSAGDVSASKVKIQQLPGIQIFNGSPPLAQSCRFRTRAYAVRPGDA